LTNTQIAVLRFGGRRLPRALASLPRHDDPDSTAIDDAVAGAPRVVVVGSAADLAAVLTRLIRTDRLDVEVAPLPRWRGSKRVLTGVAQRIPLIRDETGTALAQAAFWLPPRAERVIHGEAVVDDDVLFDGVVTAVRVEPTTSMPGLRAAVWNGRIRPRRWLTGRAVQLGTTGTRVVRDGVPMPREVQRSAFYRHTTGWLRVG
jgi:hypothetical protein